MHVPRLFPVVIAVFAAFSSPALAQSTGHGAHGAAPDPMGQAMEKMHRDMAIEPSGNADLDFIRAMIPHHQGAVEMAQSVLDNGTDPAVRTLAEQVIAAQQAEIAWMENWLANNPAD